MTVGGDFGKIIDVVGRKLSFLRFYPGNVRLRTINMEERSKIDGKRNFHEIDGFTIG